MIKELHEKLVKKEISALELVKQYFEQIKKTDKEIGAFLNLTENLAEAAAKKTDKKIAMDEKIDILEGIPCAIKDNILIKGEKCTAGSKILENYFASYDATVVEKLKEKGAVILGKTNMDEFAMGSSTENSAFFKTKNPCDLERVPGGSSGGSAAAVASGQCVFALGSDTGGSIRQPAAFCGIVGLKPTYGRISRYGLIAMASSLDQIGPLTKTIEDAEIVFNAIKGKDELDSTTIDPERQMSSANAVRNKTLKTSADPLTTDRISNGIKSQKLRIGFPQECFGEGLDPLIKQAINECLLKMEKIGFQIHEVSLPSLDYALAVYYIIMPSEVSTNLARFDGIKYGFSAEKENLFETYLKSRAKGFGKEARRRIIFGTYVLSHGYYEAYYKKAQKVRTKIIEEYKKVFNHVDVLITPTSPILPFKFGEKTKNPLSMYLSDIYTVPVNIAGLPALSLNCGFAQIDGKKLPIGLQITGKWFDEKTIFEAAKEIEQLCPIY